MDACAQAVVQMKSDVKKPNLTLTSDLLTGSSFSRLSETKNGELLLNLKMRQYYEAPGGVVLTEFVDKKTMKDIAPNAMIGRKCSVIFEMLIDSIFVGSTITIQTKLDRACVSEKKAPVIHRTHMVLPPEIDDEVHEEGEGEDGAMKRLRFQREANTRNKDKNEKKTFLSWR